ncbi:MAG: hypothetical protein E7296_06060 [Lachnospiraceae bacterium]|jgi:hypothetical protein|nr:hypothetical protein [Lachnospiraceae bacterium]
MSDKGLVDEKGVINKANKILPVELTKDFIEAIAELEDNEAHRTRQFPKTRLHKVEGAKGVYRADIDKTSGWRIHLMFGEKDSLVHLCDVLEGKEHDRVQKVIKNRKELYK